MIRTVSVQTKLWAHQKPLRINCEHLVSGLARIPFLGLRGFKDNCPRNFDTCAHVASIYCSVVVILCLMTVDEIRVVPALKVSKSTKWASGGWSDLPCQSIGIWQVGKSKASVFNELGIRLSNHFSYGPIRLLKGPICKKKCQILMLAIATSDTEHEREK